MNTLLDKITPNQRSSDTGAISAVYTALADASRQFKDGIEAISTLGTVSSGSFLVGDPAWTFVNDAIGAIRPASTDTYAGSFHSVFADYTTVSGGLQSTQWTGIVNQEILGASSAGKFGYAYALPYTGLDELYVKTNPLPQFAMTKLVFQYVTGSSSSNVQFFSLVGSGFTSLFGRLDRYVVGTITAGIVSGGMMAYCWYMIGRIFELVFFWLVSIFLAFTDDGEGARFKTCFVLIVNKTFSIVVVQLVFALVNALINAGFVSEWLDANPVATSATGFDAQRAGVMLAAAMVFAFGYPIADTLCGLIFKEPGKLRTLQDQYERIQGTGRGSSTYARGTQTLGRSAVGGVQSLGKNFTNSKTGSMQLPSFFKKGGGK